MLISFPASECGAQIHVVYKSIGEKAHLTLKEQRNITQVKWRKDHALIATVEDQKSNTKHPEKFHIHATDKSLFIKNLTVKDSGRYHAQTGQWEEVIIQYNLIVQGKFYMIYMIYQKSNTSVLFYTEIWLDTKCNHRLFSNNSTF